MDFISFKNNFEFQPVEIYPNTVPEKVTASILVQTYNHGPYIRKCLENLVNQETDFAFEILIGEDLSNDNTRAICVEYALKYPSIIRLFLHNRKNNIMVSKVPTGNFNAFYNLFSARGEFITFCEGDDYWGDQKKLNLQVKFLQTSKDFVLTFHSYKTVDENGVEISSPVMEMQPQYDLSEKDLMYTKFLPLFQTICFRNKLKKIPQEVLEVINVDTFILSLLGNYGKAKFQRTIKPSIYRIQNRGTWSSKQRIAQLKMKLNTYKKMNRYYKSKDLEVAKYFKAKASQIKKMIWYKRLNAKIGLKFGRIF